MDLSLCVSVYVGIQFLFKYYEFNYYYLNEKKNINILYQFFYYYYKTGHCKLLTSFPEFLASVAENDKMNVVIVDWNTL